MQEKKHGLNFWLGNAVLALAMVILLFMGTLWERLGVGAMILWAVIAGLGAYLVMSDKGEGPSEPD